MTVQPVAEPSSWDPIDLRGVLAGERSGPTPSLLSRSDGKHLMYPGKVHSIAGEPGSGKSWIAQVVAAEVLMRGAPVICLDFEDSPESLVSRLRALGVPDEVIVQRFGYVSPSAPLLKSNPVELQGWIDASTLVVIDGVTDAMALHAWDPLSNEDTAKFMQTLVARFAASSQDPTVILVDHVTKAKSDRGGYAIGAQHKMAAVHVQFTIKTIDPFDSDHAGEVRLSVTKDRYGQIQRLADHGRQRQREVASVRFYPSGSPGGGLSVSVDPPNRPASHSVASHEQLEQKILALIRDDPGALTKTSIKSAIHHRDADVGTAVDRLFDSGRIRPIGGPVGAKWEVTKPAGLTWGDSGMFDMPNL